MTQKRLKEVLNYNEQSGVFTWKTAKAKRISVGDVAGCINKKGYITIRIDNKIYFAHRLAWLYVYGKMPNENIDHINQIKDDNRILNLREVDCAENNKNKPMQENNTSGVTGVTWHKKAKRWQAYIQIDGTQKHLGLFASFSDAVDARKNAEVLYNFHKNHGN